jgi:cytochrome c-type biogenesis protein CcmH
MMMRHLLATLMLILAIATPALALQPGEALDDPALEARAREISKELRCLVCQNQSIDDSDAELAADLRHLVRDRLQEGDSDAQVLDYIVARYGEFVLLRPPFELATLLLWFTPFAVIVLGGGALYLAQRRRRDEMAPQTLDLDEKSRVSALLDENRK